MDRIINVKVGGNYISKDNKNAGVKGEGNVTSLRITFDEGWRYYAKTVTFFDALGGNPVKRMETVDLIEDITTDALTYITPIPPEPLAIAGEMTFVIDGYLDGKRQRSIADKLVVKDAPIADTAGEPTDPTPTEPEQWQAQVDKIIDDIQQAAIARDEAAQFAEDASGAADWADSLARNAQVHELNAYGYARNAQAHELNAYGYATKAETALTHNPVIVDGNWHVWDATTEQYKDTGVKAQAGSTVYYGDNPPDNADVWIDPEGESAYNEIKNYIDEQTEILKSDVEGLQAQINEEAHFRGYLPTNAKIKALEATPNDFAYSAESGTKWVYDAESGWIDTGSPVPDQLTPASETTPLINGVASVGKENAYARGDHRHPTDTTREDKNNKIHSIDEMTGDGTQYMSADLTYSLVTSAETNASNMGMAHADMKFGEASERMDGIDGDLAGKEDKSNKVTELTADSTDEQYPTAKAAYDSVQSKTAWELIKSRKLTEHEQLNILTWADLPKLKEIYLYFKIPTMNPDKTADFPKAKIMLYNADKVDTNKCILYEQNLFMTDTGVTRIATYHIQTFGKRCEVKRVALTETQVDNSYNQNISSIMSVSVSKELDNPYIDKLTAYMMNMGTRYFPVDTEYELWGVRA